MAVAPVHAPKRRLVYGLNVGISVVLALAVLVLAIYFAERFRRQADLTGEAGLNSLSPRTQKLLDALDQDVKLTGVYGVVLANSQLEQKYYDRVRDLLLLFESSGNGRIESRMIDPMKEPKQVTELLAGLKDKPKYKDEAAPHAAALEQFPELNARIIETMNAQKQRFTSLDETHRSLRSVPEFNIVALNFDATLEMAQKTGREVDQLLHRGEIPRYGRAVESARSYLTELRQLLSDLEQWLSGPAQSIAGLPPEAGAAFHETAQQFKSLAGDVDVLLKKMADLKPVELESLYDALANWAAAPAILVETPEQAYVVPFHEVWPTRNDRDAPPPPDGDPREFAGEQPVASAILRLTQKVRTAIIFVHYGGMSPIESLPPMNPMMQMPPAPFANLNEQLQQANFITAAWDVKSQKTPPKLEDAGATVYVVLPPQPPQQPNPMQPPSEPEITEADKRIIFDAVKNGAGGLFLAGWQAPTSPMMPMGGVYAFADYLRSVWGIDVQYRYMTIQFRPSPSSDDLWVPANRSPQLVSTQAIELTDQPIARPLQSLPGAFPAVAPLRFAEHRCVLADAGEFTSVERKEDRDPIEVVGRKADGTTQLQAVAYPANRWTLERARKDCESRKGTFEPATEGNVQMSVVARVMESPDVWAFQNINRIQNELRADGGTRPHEDDIRTPFPIAVAAVNTDSGNRLAVVSSEEFAADGVAGAQALERTSSGFRLYAAYPANTELFINTMYWLAGQEDHIAVGPRRGPVAVLDKLKDDSMLPVYRGVLVGTGPVLALIAGAVVWFMRRR